MNVVDPIRDEYVLEDVLKYFKYKNANTEYQQYINDRNYIMLLLGVNSGLRISDIIKLRVGDIIYDHFKITEVKTKKKQLIYINNSVAKEINEFINRYMLKKSDYLFKSRQVDKISGKQKHISTTRAYQILKGEIEPLFDVEIIGTHTMRKTFGYMYYKQTQDIAMLQELFGHSSPEVTLRYIGITQDVKNDIRRNFKACSLKI